MLCWDNLTFCLLGFLGSWGKIGGEISPISIFGGETLSKYAAGSGEPFSNVLDQHSFKIGTNQGFSFWYKSICVCSDCTTGSANCSPIMQCSRMLGAFAELESSRWKAVLQVQ